MVPFQDNASHFILILKHERYSKSKGRRTTSSFFVVDLANSALVRKPPADAGPAFVRECKSVKKSLGTLRKCIRCLASEQKLPSLPYGESVLTQVLHNGLVRGSGIIIIVTANLELQHAQESLSAIRFGTYVAGQKAEEIDKSVMKPSAVEGGSESSPRSPDSRRSSETFPAIELSSVGRRRSFESARLPTSRLPSESAKLHPRNMSDFFNCAPASSEFTSSSEATAGELHKMPARQTNGLAVKCKMKTSGSDTSLSYGKMQKQLETLSPELKRIQYGGHASELELERLLLNAGDSSNSLSNVAWKARKSLTSHLTRNDSDQGVYEREVTPVRPGAGSKPLNGFQAQSAPYLSQSHATGAGREVEVLRAELADLKEAYELLQQQQSAKAKELVNARQEIQG